MNGCNYYGSYNSNPSESTRGFVLTSLLLHQFRMKFRVQVYQFGIQFLMDFYRFNVKLLKILRNSLMAQNTGRHVKKRRRTVHQIGPTS